MDSTTESLSNLSLLTKHQTEINDFQFFDINDLLSCRLVNKLWWEMIKYVEIEELVLSDHGINYDYYPIRHKSKWYLKERKIKNAIDVRKKEDKYYILKSPMFNLKKLRYLRLDFNYNCFYNFKIENCA